ncbi:MAG: uracil-DNA glycosylase family protein [Candidatus Dormibacteria bacterium]
MNAPLLPPLASDPAPPGASLEWAALHHDILACTRCVISGHLAEAKPMFQGAPGQPLMLVGQAPGIVELGPRKPFAGRAGAELGRWMARAGFASDYHFRALTYVTSVTKCFPGKAVSGSGDRRPTNLEVGQCRGWLSGQLRLARPRLVLLVGTLAINEFLPTGALQDQVGRIFDSAGDEVVTLEAAAPGAFPLLLPLPHPSGASRWLNDLAHRDLLEQALGRLGATWPRLTAAAGCR